MWDVGLFRHLLVSLMLLCDKNSNTGFQFLKPGHIKGFNPDGSEGTVDDWLRELVYILGLFHFQDHFQVVC